MKKYSRTLVLALTGAALKETGLSLEIALQLPIGKTAAGRRSLIYYLAKENQIWLERHLGKLRVGLTAQGTRQLQRQFPALSGSDRSMPIWQLLLLKDAPKNDPHFRTLGGLCLKYRALRLARGIYAYPGELPSALEMHVRSLYSDVNLARCTVGEWLVGLDRPQIVAYYDIEHLAAIYSSISREIDRLLMQYSSDNEFIYPTIINIYSVIDRLETALIADYGLVSSYFPETPRCADLVDSIGTILKRIETAKIL